MILSQVWIDLKQGWMDENHQLDEFIESEVQPGYLVSNDESIVTKEFVNCWHFTVDGLLNRCSINISIVAGEDDGVSQVPVYNSRHHSKFTLF